MNRQLIEQMRLNNVNLKKRFLMNNVHFEKRKTFVNKSFIFTIETLKRKIDFNYVDEKSRKKQILKFL